MRRPLLVLAVVASVLAPAAMLGAGGDDATPPELTFSLTSSHVEFGRRVVVTGAAGPAMASADVVVDVDRGAGPIELARTVADPLGNFTASFVAGQGGEITVRVPTVALVSDPQTLDVVPRVRVRVAAGRAFFGARVVVRVRPASYAGTIALSVRRGGADAGHAAGYLRRGRLVLVAPTPGVGRFNLELELPAGDGLAARTVRAKAVAAGRTLSVGASGPDVAGLTQRLTALHVRVPGASSTYGYELLDSVYAFQKAYGLARTGVVGPETWRKLFHAQPLKPRHRGPAAHIEVDKTRQVLLDVRNGEVDAILPVSTGATGNTPEGTHHIRWKALATTTWLGPAILYRTLDFYGNSFAIHGFPSVPPYPASHGCVRIPIWTADWLYQRSPVGETVYVYR
jgi:hypothetical protein